MMVGLSVRLAVPCLLLASFFVPVTRADVGIISFWVPELFVLLGEIEEAGNPIETYIFGARKFYVTKFKGHNVVAVNTGVGISNTAATVAILLQKFPTIDRIVGSGIAGGVDPSLVVGDVVVPERWFLYQKQHFAKEAGGVQGGGEHIIPGWQVPTLVGTDCGAGISGSEATAVACTLGVDTWNYTFIYPAASYGADPTAEGVDATSEGSRMYGWFDVDPDMYAIAASVATNITLAKSSGGDVVLDYQPVVVPGGNGVSGPTFVDNAAYREYVFNTFEAKALDMESAALAHVATQFGVKFLVFRSLSDLAGGDAAGNVLSVFFSVAAANAVATMSAFMEALPIENSSDAYPTPMDHTPGEDTTGLLGVLSFWQPELEALKAIMNEGKPEELVFGGRIFYRGMIHGADVVATLTGVSISNTAMTTALMAMLYPGIERITGGGIAGGVDPLLKVGDVVVPERWALYQMQIYGREISDGVYEPPSFDRDLIVGKSCGAFDGVDTFLMGDGPCDYLAGEASRFGMIFPTSIQTPNPNDPLGENQISEGPTRKWWFDVDPVMLEVAKNATQGLVLKNASNGVTLDYTPEVFVGGNGVSGPTFVDNAQYRQYVYDEFQALCLDMETAAAAHIAYQNNISVLFFRSLSDLAGADQDGNVMQVFFAVAAENAFTVMSAFIAALYPVTKVVDVPTTAAPTTGAPPTSTSGGFVKQCWSTLSVVACLLAAALAFYDCCRP